LMLVFAAEHGDEEATVGEVSAEVDDGFNVCLADHVAAVAQLGVHLQLRTDHHREGEISLGANGENDLSENLLPRAAGLTGGILSRVSPLRRKTDGDVNRLHSVEPVA